MYEINLLEILQVLREAEAKLKSRACVNLLKFRQISQLKVLAKRELLAYRSGKKDRNLDLIKLMEN